MRVPWAPSKLKHVRSGPAPRAQRQAREDGESSERRGISEGITQQQHWIQSQEGEEGEEGEGEEERERPNSQKETRLNTTR